MHPIIPGGPMHHAITDAERITIYELLNYLAPAPDKIWTIEDACITVQQTHRRTGVPADATAWRYEINMPEPGLTVFIRSVFRHGVLMRPLSTHTQVESFHLDDDRQEVAAR